MWRSVRPAVLGAIALAGYLSEALALTLWTCSSVWELDARVFRAVRIGVGGGGSKATDGTRTRVCRRQGGPARAASVPVAGHAAAAARRAAAAAAAVTTPGRMSASGPAPRASSAPRTPHTTPTTLHSTHRLHRQTHLIFSVIFFFLPLRDAIRSLSLRFGVWFITAAAGLKDSYDDSIGVKCSMLLFCPLTSCMVELS